MPKPGAAYLTALRRTVHAAFRQLGIDDEQRRDIQQRATGKASTGDMGRKELEAVLAEAERLGWVNPKRAKARRPKGGGREDDQLGKIRALLRDMGMEWAYADGIARQMFGLDFAQWTQRGAQRQAVITALRKEQEKRELRLHLRSACAVHGIAEADLVSEFGLSPGWDRRRDTLKRLIAAVTARGLQ